MKNDSAVPIGSTWLAFSPDTPEDQARRRFVERTGRQPERTVLHKGLLLVGPLSTGTEPVQETLLQ
ncbi:MAG: hypothetical protein U9R05_09610 [Chloroflexota bacterium]|nr:hypothetical protein [Chloroflexota bacterium]